MNTQTFWRSKCLAGLAVMALAASIPALAETVNLDGRWDASITQKGGTVIPFRLDISGSVDHLVGTLHNGAADTETTTSASFQNGVLTLQFEHYLTNIEATVKEGELDGKLLVTRRSAINITPGKLSEAPGDVATPSTPSAMWRRAPKRSPRSPISMASGKCRMNRPRAKSPGG